MRPLHHTPFSRALWDKWLARLNAAPEPALIAGIQEMRELLQMRCLGDVRNSIEDTGQFRAFVAQNFGVLK